MGARISSLPAEEGEIADAYVLVQSAQLGHLFGTQLKVEDIQILLEARLISALRYGHNARVDDPADQHLGRRLLVCLGDLLNLRYVHQVGQVTLYASSRVELGNALGAERGVRRNGNILCLAEVDQIALLQVHMVLDLIGGWTYFAIL